MRFADAEKTVLIINEHVQLMGIREAVHRYVVNGRTPRRLSEPGFMGFTGFCQTSCHPYQESGHPQGVSLQLTYFRILLQKPRFFVFFTIMTIMHEFHRKKWSLMHSWVIVRDYRQAIKDKEEKCLRQSNLPGMR